ncbi:MAG: BREX system Lon protease-like protein BrxL [Methanophagales archaeon ANME-1-THS]|nr:MAG: BREX system Lon protease-like protein BrxL [Methanophagales archaeon ANME-1-THS]
MPLREEVNEKLSRAFLNEIINKRLSTLQEVSRLPRFISEYAIKEICGEDPTPSDLATLSDFVKKYYPEPKERDRILHELMTKGEYTLLDSLKTSVDIKRGIHKVEIPCLRIHDARIMQSILETHKELLEAGMWGIATLKYAPLSASEEEETQSPVLITNFEPLQYSGIKIEEFKEKRGLFSTEEWITVLINTFGLNPEVYTERGRLLLLSRLVPLIEENVNMFELGPRATGKSFLPKNISYYTRLYSGGRISPAVLFFHGTFKTIGDIGVKDYVIFDEISKVNFSNPDEMMGKLKDYMESGEFERGLLRRARSGCSLMFMGNVEVEGEVPAEDFSSVLPSYMKDSAFIDRIHGFIPGWELPKILQTDVHLSTDYGFITDYFCEILHEMRKESFQRLVEERVALKSEPENLTIRDEKSVKKIASGMLKILCPHGVVGNDELKMCMDIAVEYRQRVVDWLHQISPGEFKPKRIMWQER